MPATSVENLLPRKRSSATAWLLLWRTCFRGSGGELLVKLELCDELIDELSDGLSVPLGTGADVGDCGQDRSG